MGGDGKASTEWLIEDIRVGNPITIYDYKMTDIYEEGDMSLREFRELPDFEWHIGSCSTFDIKALGDFIDEQA